MNRFDPLGNVCLVPAVLQTKPISEPVIGDMFESFEDGCLRDFTACNQPIAMIAVSDTEYVVRGHSLPKSNVIQGVQPLINIRQIFKDNHDTSVPHPCFKTNFLATRSPQDGI